MSTEVTAMEVFEAMQKSTQSCIPFNDCSICGYTCCFVVIGPDLYYDSGCDCVAGSNIQHREWSLLAQQINQVTDDYRPKLIERLGLTEYLPCE